MSSAPSAKLPPLFRWVIWFALFNAVGIYLIILLFVPGDEVTDSLDAMVKDVLLGTGFGGAVISMAIRQIVKTNTKRVDGVTVAPAWIDQAFIAALALAESPPS